MLGLGGLGGLGRLGRLGGWGGGGGVGGVGEAGGVGGVGGLGFESTPPLLSMVLQGGHKAAWPPNLPSGWTAQDLVGRAVGWRQSEII